MKKIPHVYLEDILVAIDHIETYLKSVTEVQFSDNAEKQDAVIRRLAIIGEAANRLDPEWKQLAPEIPWRTIIGFRNVVIHEYSGVSLGRVWKIVQTDLPELKRNIQKLLKNIPPPEKIQ